MSLFLMLVHTPAAKALGWTVFHFLWEGAVIALVLAAALFLTRSSGLRCRVACAALLLMLATFGFTFVRALAAQQPRVLPAASIALPGLPPDSQSATGGLPSPVKSASELLPWLAPFWMAGVLVLQARALLGWFGIRRMRRRGVCRAPEEWQHRLEALAARLRVARPVLLLESCVADVPVVLGYLRPAVLIPVGLLAGLPPAQVDAILIHELAHIRRHDYLLNLLQTMAESILFFHPAAWWVSGIIRNERENCCDDCVVAVHGDVHGYALALTQLEQNRSAARELAVAATGGHLMKRIRRMLGRSEGPRLAWSPFLTVSLLLTTAVAITAFQAPAPQSPAPPRMVAQVAVPAEPQNMRREKPAAALETPYRKWVNEDVAYIITDEERAAFLRLQADPERERFVEQFWIRRDPTPGTVENEFKEEHYRRIAYANGHYASSIPGWKTDRGRIYITFGPPDEIESHPAEGKEQWLYHMLPGIGTNVIIEFTDPTHSGDYRMTADPRVPDRRWNGPGDVFYSVEPGQPAMVKVLPNKLLLVNIPFEFEAGRYIVSGMLSTADGRHLQSFEQAMGPCAEKSGCRFSRPLSIVEPGTYICNLTVKDSDTGTAKNYTVNVNVN